MMVILVGVIFVLWLYLELVFQKTCAAKKDLGYKKQFKRNLPEWLFRDLIENKPENKIARNHINK